MFKVENIEPAAWDKFKATIESSNFLQSRAWFEHYQILNNKIIYRVVRKGEKIVAGYGAVIKNARRGRYMEVPGGPLTVDWQDKALLETVVSDIKTQAKAHKCVFVRIRMQLVDSEQSRQLAADLGLKKAPMHLHAEHTNILDLGPDVDELLAKMRKQTRYEVRKADRRGVKVSWSNDQQAIDQFHQLQVKTANRKGFIPPSLNALQAQSQAFGDKLRVYQATKDGQLLNMAIFVNDQHEIDYLEAASTMAARKEPGAYAILWQAIADYKHLGCRRLNLWGIAFSDDPKHRYAGMTTFKRGFGGEDVTYLPAQDLVISRGRYLLTYIIETIRRKRRKL